MPNTYRKRTVNIDVNEVDFMVTEFTSYDSSFLRALGSHSKVEKWKVHVTGREEAIEIEVQVDKGVVGGPEVCIKVDGQQLFPKQGKSKKAKLKEDFLYKWPFRGQARGINEPFFYEVQPPISEAGASVWHPATVMSQREDGNFEVLVQTPCNEATIKEIREVCYPALPARYIRDASTNEQIHVPHRVLILKVPKRDPLQAMLSVDGFLITHFLGRLTTVRGDETRIVLTVNKARTIVTGNVGHSVLVHQLSGEPRRVEWSGTKQKVSWTVQIGPFCEHLLELEKKRQFSKVFTLSIDGTILVESSGDDIDNDFDGLWYCQFRLIGMRELDFSVFETTRHGDPLDSMAIVSRSFSGVHMCEITVHDEKDLSSTELRINDVNFKRLLPKAEPHPEPNLAVKIDAMQAQYDLRVPYKVNDDAADTGIGLSIWAIVQECGFSRLLNCCSRPAMMPVEVADELFGQSRIPRPIGPGS